MKQPSNEPNHRRLDQGSGAVCEGRRSEKLATVEKTGAQVATWPAGVRDAWPGLQAHRQYLAGLGTRTDQEVRRDAFEQLAALKKEYARLGAEADQRLDQQEDQ